MTTQNPKGGPMRNALVKMAFAILRRYDAKLWWNTADVPGLFDPRWKGRMVFKFGTMRLYPPASETARAAGIDDGGFNFSHPCPPDCD